MIWIVCPSFTVGAAIPVAVKPMAVEEAVVDEYCAAEPVRAPAPTAPEAKINAGPPAKSIHRIVQRRVRTPHRRTPDVRGVIGRDVNYLGVGRLNEDSRLAPLGFRAHSLLRCRL
jgi:hypothetical protein